MLLYHVDWQTVTDISKDCNASIFKVQHSWVVMLCGQLNSYHVSKYCSTCSSWITYPEDEDTMIFQKRGNYVYVPVNTGSHHTRPECLTLRHSASSI